MSKLGIVFLGTGDIALPAFRSLLASDEVNLLGLVTQPDKPVGRKQILTPPAIKEVAAEHGVRVMQPERAGDKAFLDELRSLSPDICVVMAYGQILTQAMLNIPALAYINLHASLLPRHRGAACIQAAIDAGDSHTGITVMHVVKALDAGDIILRKKIRIGEHETGGELHDRLAGLAPDALTDALQQLANGTATRTLQDVSQVTHIPKLMRRDGEIDWSQPADALERRIRAYHPWPGTSTTYTDTKGRTRRLKIFPQTTVGNDTGAPGEILSTDGHLRIACGEGSLEITNIQPDGARRMKVSDFLLGDPIAAGDKLGG